MSRKPPLLLLKARMAPHAGILLLTLQSALSATLVVELQIGLTIGTGGTLPDIYVPLETVDEADSESVSPELLPQGPEPPVVRHAVIVVGIVTP